MSGKCDAATGVKVCTIGGRMTNIRQRCLGMTDAERQWRAQFLKDQQLSHSEPRNVPEFYKDTTNIIRRLWKTPLYNFQKALGGVVGAGPAYQIRHGLTKASMMIGATYIFIYILKYHANDWTLSHKWHYYLNRLIYPDDPDYLNYRIKTAQEYVDDGFYSSPYALKVEKSQFSPSSGSYQTMNEKTEKIVCEK